MAGISTISYCTDQDIYDIYPRISEYDLKRPIYNFTESPSNIWTAHNTGLITVLFADGLNAGAEKQGILGTADHNWIYTEDEDKLTYYNATTNPNSMIMEAGDDFETTQLRFRRKASRLIESFLGSAISREIMKGREGNYPTSIIHATALKSVILFISAHDPSNTDLAPLNEEYDDIMGKIKAGKIVMTGHRTKDDSKGQIRIVEEPLVANYEVHGATGELVIVGTVSNDVYPVELRGSYRGDSYELLKVKIEGSLLSKSYILTEDTTIDDVEYLTGDIVDLTCIEQACEDNDAGVAPFGCATAVVNWGCDFLWAGTPIGEICPETCGAGCPEIEREDELRELFYSVWGKSNTDLKETLLVDNELVSGDFQTLGVSDLYIRWGISEWKKGSGDVQGLMSTPRAIKLAEGAQGNVAILASGILYTGTNGEAIQDLYDEGYLPNVTGINKAGQTANLSGGTWEGSLMTLNNRDEGNYILYSVITDSAQDEIIYKDGLPIWSKYSSGAEYEIELWGSNIQPTVPQIDSTLLTRRNYGS